jgi:hypothetical protein
VWLRGLDSNQDNQIQSLVCCRLHYPGAGRKSLTEALDSAQCLAASCYLATLNRWTLIRASKLGKNAARLYNRPND